ncbi:hypothetical protein EON79_10445 [bacterium]|nr:MAG: hypothetical protein EON79_10445 [bacterium]
MNRTKNVALSLAALLAVGLAVLPAQAEAQSRRWGKGQPAQNRRQWQVKPLIVRVERESNSFRAWFERSDSRRDSNLKRDVQRLDESLERLRSRASDNRPGVGREDLQNALRYAQNIDRRIYRSENRKTNREWSDLRRTLGDLARVYGLRGL